MSRKREGAGEPGQLNVSVPVEISTSCCRYGEDVENGFLGVVLWRSSARIFGRWVYNSGEGKFKSEREARAAAVRAARAHAREARAAASFPGRGASHPDPVELERRPPSSGNPAQDGINAARADNARADRQGLRGLSIGLTVNRIETAGPCRVCHAAADEECVSIENGNRFGTAVHGFGGRFES